MLVRYTVENFKSFKEKVVFSMVPGRGTLKKEHKAAPVKGVSALKLSLAFGANASGKSNLVKAIAFGKKLLLGGTKGEAISYEPYSLDGNSICQNSMMKYEIQTNGENYSYCFVFNRRMIVQECLLKNGEHGQLVFSLKRDESNGDIEFIFDYLKRRNKSEEAQQFIQFIAKATPKNHLFLHEVFSRNMKQNVHDIEDLNAVIDWFAYTLQVILPNETYKMGFTLKAAGSEELRKAYSEILHYFDAGVKSINLVNEDFDKLSLPPDLANRIKSDLLGSPKAQMGILAFCGNMFLVSAQDGRIRTQKLMTVHIAENRDDVAFDLTSESDGTVRLLDYIPLIIDLILGDKVFVVDEMERSLHPNLMQALIDLFVSLSHDVNSQLILTTHESTLMSQTLIRKDEVHFVVKEEGRSFLIALEDYGVRYDKDIRSEYLKGTYKGVPHIGDKERLRDFFCKTVTSNGEKTMSQYPR